MHAALEKKYEQVAATQPAGNDAMGMHRQIIGIDLLKITIDPSGTPEQKVKRKEEVGRRV